jgi:recombinational DNA repair ATPase RecF
MLITRVELQNTRSYRDQTVTFAEGTNAICGENGAGKSTLLAAIGFALFNHLTNTQSEFVREGSAPPPLECISSPAATAAPTRWCASAAELGVLCL